MGQDMGQNMGQANHKAVKLLFRKFALQKALPI